MSSPIQSPTATGGPTNLTVDQLLNYYLSVHDIISAPESSCALKENRIAIQAADPTNQTGQKLYCWKGIASNDGSKCEIATICSPYSYSTARTAFCRAFNCPQPYLYVGQLPADADLPVSNERGGIIVYNAPTSCGTGITGWLNCIVSGVRQSADNLLDPDNKTHLILTVVVSMLALFGIAFYFGTHRKEFKAFRHPKDVFK